jgi:hypothetical protein
VSFSDAVKKPEWQAAMDEEYKSLIANKTWKLCELPVGRKAMKCKWVYKTKVKPNGDVDRCKARLVAKGYSQSPGLDYNETYSLVVKYDSIRLVFALVDVENLEMIQFDIKTAFLHGELEEEIYMEQPEGYYMAKDGDDQHKHSHE